MRHAATSPDIYMQNQGRRGGNPTLSHPFVDERLERNPNLSETQPAVATLLKGTEIGPTSSIRERAGRDRYRQRSPNPGFMLNSG